MVRHVGASNRVRRMSNQDSEPDLTEFIELSVPPRRYRPCKVARARENLTADEQAALDAACSADRSIIGVGGIYQWLQVRGHEEVSLMAVTNHRARKCACFGHGRH